MLDKFTCKLCQFTDTYEEFESPNECPECGGRFYELRFNVKPEPKVNFVNIGYKDTPRYSASMGVSETQIEAAKKLHPQAEWKKFGHSYRPLIKNRPDKLKMMKQCGMCEYDPKAFKGRDS